MAKIQEYAIPVSVRLKVLGPPKTMTMGSATHVALYEDALTAGLRFSIPVALLNYSGGIRWLLLSLSPTPGR